MARPVAYRRTLSVRVLLLSLVLVGAGLPSLYALRKWQLSRTATAYLDRASELEKQEEWLAAANYIGRYLALRQHDADAEVRLAETYAKGADSAARIKRAVELYYTALGNELGDRQWPLRQKLASLLVDLGRFAEAEGEARKLIAHDPASPEANKSLALALIGRVANGSFTTASQAELKKLALLATFDRARKMQPKDIELATLQAVFLRRFPDLVKVEQPKWTQAQRYENADACLNELIAADPTNAKAYLARHYYRQQISEAAPDGGAARALAAADLAQALKLAPQDGGVLAVAGAAELAAAQTAQAGGLKEEVLAHAAQAEAYYQSLVSIPNQTKQSARPPRGQSRVPGGFHIELGEAQWLRDKPDEAIATWKSAIKKFEGDELKLETRLADAYLDLDRRKEARDALAQVDKRIDQNSPFMSNKEQAAQTAAQEFRRARLAFQSQDMATSIPQLQRVAARSEAGSASDEVGLRALVMLGQAYSSLGQWREAAQVYDEACQRNPRLPQVRLYAAHSWLASGRIPLAAERAEQSLALRDSTEAWFVLCSAIFRQQLGLETASRDWERFDLTLSETKKRNQSTPLAQPWLIELLQIDALLARGQEGPAAIEQEVQQVVRDLEARYPNEVQLWTRLPLVWERLKLPAEADRCAEQLGKQPEGKVAALQAKVRLHRARGEHDRAEEMMASLVASSPAELRSDMVRELVNLKLAREDFDGARQLLVKEHELRPDELATLLFLAELDVQSGRWKEVQKWEHQLEKLPHPATLHAKVIKIRRLLASSKSPGDAAFAEAEAELRVLRDRAASWPEVAALSGSVAQQRGDLTGAATGYTQAVMLGDQRMGVYQNLIAVLERLGRLSEAQEYLQKLESQIPLNQALTMLQGTVEMRLDQPERALSVARKAVEKRPQEIEPRLWLARLLALDGKQAEAESELNKALEMAPQDLRVWTALEMFYVRAQKSDAAIQMAQRIQQDKDLPEAERYFIAAQAFDLAGKRDLAEESFRRAAAADPKSGAVQFRMAEFYLRFDTAKAQTCLEKTLALEPEHRSARRTLAALLASRGSDEDWSRAESLLTSQAQDSSNSAGDNRLHAVLLARRGGAANLAQAQLLLEQLVSKSIQSLPIDRLLLAQVYERQALTPLDEKTKAKKLELARRELEALASRAEPDWTHFAAAIEFFDRQRQPADCRHWLGRFQQWALKQRRPASESILQLVRLQLKHQAAAESGPWLDQLETLKADPLSILLLRAQWYRDQGRPEEIRQHVDARGEELLAQEQNAAAKARILGRVAGVYRAVKQLDDAERWERRLAAHDPQQFDGLAAVLTQQGKWSEAIELCRQAAQTDKSARPAMVALNCLSGTQVTNERVADLEPLIQAAMQDSQARADLHYSLGVVRVVQNRNADAIAEFRQVVKLNPRHVPAMNNLALLLAEDTASRKEALAIIDRAIDQDGMTPDLCDTKGTILLLDGRADEAIRFLEIATQGTNVDPRFEFHLALAYDDQGNREKAREHFQKAIQGRLEEQILTKWDQQMLAELRKNLGAST